MRPWRAELARVRDFGALKDDLARLIPDRMKRAAADERRRDALVAAAFVLEVLSAGFEMEWRQLAPLLEVACQLIRSRGPADDAERVWMLGSIALAAGARDRILLDAHLPHARARFPAEPRFQLAEATAAELGSDHESMPIGTGATPAWLARKRIVINGLAALTKVPAISAEAELHVGYLLFQIGDRKQALAHLRLADQTTDAFVRYLSRFLAGPDHAQRKTGRAGRAGVPRCAGRAAGHPIGVSGARDAALHSWPERRRLYAPGGVVQPSSAVAGSVAAVRLRRLPALVHASRSAARGHQMNIQCIPRASAVAMLVLAGAGLTAQDQRPVFRSRADAVVVNAAVRRGNVPALGLQPADFRLLDNGVVQTVTSLDYEAVPIDVTLFLDTSPSLSGLLEELKRDMAKIAAMLRPGDRLRLLTFGYQVDDVFGWRPAGADLPLEIARVGRLSSVSDAILLALLHRPQVDRRHLVIAMTDAMDAGSQVEMSQLRAVSARAEAVLHVMVMPSS